MRGSRKAATANSFAAHRAAMAVIRRQAHADGSTGARKRRPSDGSVDTQGSASAAAAAAAGDGGDWSPELGAYRSSSAGLPPATSAPPPLARRGRSAGASGSNSVGSPSPGTRPLHGVPEESGMIDLQALPFLQGDAVAGPLYDTKQRRRSFSSAGSGAAAEKDEAAGAASPETAEERNAAGRGFTSTSAEEDNPDAPIFAGAASTPLPSSLPGAGGVSPRGRTADLTRAPQQGAVAQAAAHAASSALAPDGGVQFSTSALSPAPSPKAGEDDHYLDGAASDASEEQDWLPVEFEEAFQRLVITGHEHYSEEARKVCREIMDVLKLRGKHHYRRADEYWGSFRPHEFSKSRMEAATDHTQPPPLHTDLTVEDQSGQVISALGGTNTRPSVSTDGTTQERVTGVPVTQGSHQNQDGTDPKLFYRRRPDLPFNVFEERDVPRQGPVRFAYAWHDGVITAHAVLPAESSSRPVARGMQGAAASEPMQPGMKVTSAQSWEWGVKEGARLYGCMPVQGEVVDRPHFAPPSFAEFRADYEQVTRLTHWAPAKSFAYRRLKLLESRFQLHKILNSEVETAESKRVPHRDFYNVRKVDTHVHHSACMTQKHLLRFIKHKLKKHPDDVVKTRDGKPVTLSQVFKELNLTAYDLSIDTLDMHADNTFHRFDRFNLKYSPIGQSILREVFLKTDNHIGGRYLAEITRQVFDDLESSKYQLAEYRLSIYGRRPNEWGKLARWVVRHRLASRNVRWMIQIPRLYELYKQQGLITTFQDMLDNIFMPLWEVSINPGVDPELHDFLSLVVGVDMVDDESKQEGSRDAEVPSPENWDMPHPPPYYYWVYYISANLNSLNHFRASRGMSVMSFRPHAGEAGEVDHLAATFLTAEGVNHGITMRKHVTLQYLYYLSQIGLAMSPLSNNKLFIEYHSNPFYTYFERGLNVSLSTDDPALFHYTREPLVEEYCVAAQVWKLNSVDMCEIARNSVLQSGFEHPYKAYWIGRQYSVPGPRGSDIHLTNVPNIRLQYRFESLIHEHSVVQEGSGVLAPMQMSMPPADTRQIKDKPAATGAGTGTGLSIRSGKGGGKQPMLSPSAHPVHTPKDDDTPPLKLDQSKQ